ncbi:MAG: efflux RND transporter periplasmic adaptor subunit [Spirochaetes bacterium]|nr:efflux RND transporter periplasmic adaptor subunit [Spirochaetota bacterium]MBU0955455.1 efflux RND transporter periplasmic adaptor subunit [Spirochaetota bacterium]
MTKAKKVIRLIIWLIPIGILAGSLLLKTTLDQATAEVATVPAIPVRVQQAVRGDLAKTLKLNGYVESESMVTVLPLVSGVLQELFVDTGDAVKKDQIIGRIDAARYELQLRQAEAAYFSAKSSYERVLQLYQGGVGSQQNLDQAKAQYDAYATQYELARLQLDYAAVKSPVDGVVLVRHLSVGAIAAPERPLVTIGDLDDLIVRARIPEKYYPLFVEREDNLPITITTSSRRQYTGKIRNISPFVSAETKNFETIIAIDDREGLLRPGMFVNMEFRLEEWEDTLSLPFQALSGGDTLWYIEDGMARSTKYIPEERSDSAFLLPEEFASYFFIIEGQYFVYEGAPVREVSGSSQP